MFPFFSYHLISSMRLLSLVFLLLIVLIQYPLWLGKGGWLRVWELDKQVQQVKASNEKLKQRNGVLASEVNDLKNGTDAVEERARFELGMIKKDEVFVQILDEGSKIEIATASKAKTNLPAPKH
jgi:cell division protein FtsB